MTASECHRNYAKIMDDPNASEIDESFAIEAWSWALFDFFGSYGTGLDAPEYTDYMHSVGIFNRDHDMELAEFYEETRWENENEFMYEETA